MPDEPDENVEQPAAEPADAATVPRDPAPVAPQVGPTVVARDPTPAAGTAPAAAIAGAAPAPAGAAPANVQAAPAPPSRAQVIVQLVLDVIVVLSCLGIALHVAMSPDAIYEKTPRVVLFTIVALLVSVQLATRVQARLELKLKGVIFTATGVAALLMTMIIVLSYLTQSTDRVMVLSFEEPNHSELSVETLDLRVTTAFGRDLEVCRHGSRAYVLLSDDVAKVHVRLVDQNKSYQKTIPASGGDTLREDDNFRVEGDK